MSLRISPAFYNAHTLLFDWEGQEVMQSTETEVYTSRELTPPLSVWQCACLTFRTACRYLDWERPAVILVHFCS
jgi:hypothetical protein